MVLKMLEIKVKINAWALFDSCQFQFDVGKKVETHDYFYIA